MREFGILKGPDLVQILATLLQEGALAHPQTKVLKAVNQDLKTYSVELCFRANALVHAVSSDYAYRLEQVLYRKRLIEKNQLDELAQLSKAQPGKSIVQLVRARQWVSEAELAEVVAHLCEIIAYEVLLWKDTSFELSDARRPEAELFGSGLPEDKLLSARGFVDNAEKNLPVLVLMREKLGNPNTIPRRLKEADREQLSDYQYHVYRYVNNRNSIRELLQVSELGYFDTYAAMFQLLSWEYIGLGQLDVPHHARGRTQDLASVETKAPPRPPTIAKPAPPKPTPQPAAESLPPPGKPGQRQFLRRGRGSELLQVLVSVMKSGYADGRVIVDNQQQIIRADFSLFKGNLVHVTTTAFNIRLGDLLVRRGVLGPGQLREALEEQKTSPNVHLGEILVTQGFVDENEIPALVLHQMEAVIYEVLAWSDVKFYFDPDAQTPQNEVHQKVRINAPFEIHDGRLSRTDQSQERNVLEEADQNLAMLLTMREKIFSLKAIPVRTGRPVGVLTDEQDAVLKQVDSRSSMQEILLGIQVPYFDAYTAIYQLLSTGVLDLPDTTGERRVTGQLPRRSAVVSPPARQTPPESVSEALREPVATLEPESEPQTEPIAVAPPLSGPPAPPAAGTAPARASAPLAAPLAAPVAAPVASPVAAPAAGSELLDAATMTLIAKVPQYRHAEVRQALQAVLRLVAREG